MKPDRRWTIEHGFIAAADQLARICELGLALSAQHHLYVAGPSLEQYWGRSRAERVTPLRTYLDHGIAVSLGSDSPSVPFPPLQVLYHFTTRDTITRGVFGSDERISREEALRAVTLGNAWCTFEQDLKGSLTAGKLADLVVVSHDIVTCSDEELLHARVSMTMVGGEVVYEAAGD